MQSLRYFELNCLDIWKLPFCLIGQAVPVLYVTNTIREARIFNADAPSPAADLLFTQTINFEFWLETQALSETVSIGVSVSSFPILLRLYLIDSSSTEAITPNSSFYTDTETLCVFVSVSGPCTPSRDTACDM